VALREIQHPAVHLLAQVRFLLHKVLNKIMQGLCGALQETQKQIAAEIKQPGKTGVQHLVFRNQLLQ